MAGYRSSRACNSSVLDDKGKLPMRHLLCAVSLIAFTTSAYAQDRSVPTDAAVSTAAVEDAG